MRLPRGDLNPRPFRQLHVTSRELLTMLYQTELEGVRQKTYKKKTCFYYRFFTNKIESKTT